MSKFNKKSAKAAALSPIVAGRTPSGRTHEGAPGYARTAQGELFLLAVSNMAGEDTFYEKATSRDDRYTQLVHRAACRIQSGRRRSLAGCAPKATCGPRR